MGVRWLMCVVFALASAVGAAERSPQRADPSEQVFGLTSVWQIELEIAAEQWNLIQPTQTFMRPGVARPATRPASDDRHPAGPMGLEFPYVHAAIRFHTTRFADIGVRFKGNSSYFMSPGGEKKPIKIDFNRYVDGQELFGLKGLNLNNNAMDTTQLREAVSYSVFRDAGVPAPRTSFVELHLTVPGKHHRQFLGLYTIIEEVDKDFLKRHFGSAKGLLLKPEGLMAGIAYFGEEWKTYEHRYRPRSEADADARRRLIEFARLVDKADDATFRAQIGDYLDVDQFLRFVAVNGLLGNLDSYLAVGHNYYLYLPPKGKFAFIPWDLNLSFGAFQMVASPKQITQLSIDHPWGGENRLIERLLAIPDVKASYHKILRDLVSTVYTPERMRLRVDAVDRAITDSRKREMETGRDFMPNFLVSRSLSQAPHPSGFVPGRVESVLAQLEGKSTGVIPRGFDGKGFFERNPGIADLLRRAAEASHDKDGKIRLPGERNDRNNPVDE